MHKALKVLKWFKVIPDDSLYIQPQNIITMCQSVSLTAASISDTAIQGKAQEIQDKFVDVFTLFSDCHKIYDSSSLLTNAEIDTLGTVW